MKRRVVITGLGAVTPVGVGVKAFWHALRQGISGIDTITTFDASSYPCRVAAEVKGFDAREFMPLKTVATTGRFVQFAIAAARMAHDDAVLAPAANVRRFAVCYGSSANAVTELEGSFQGSRERGTRRISPSIILQGTAHGATGHVSEALALNGPRMTIASGCVTGIDVVRWAYDQVNLGLVAGVLAGATETPLSAYTHAAFSSLGMLSNWPGRPAAALRPFDAMHDGFVLGEGAGALVAEDLENAWARGAHMYAEVLGFGIASEAKHVNPPDGTSTALEAAIRAALRMARLEPCAIDHINGHGNALPSYDRAETAAYRRTFGARAYSIPVSSIKPMTGQSLAAVSALQVIAACLTLETQFVPPTLNHDIPDSACDLDYVPNRGRVARVDRVLVTAHAIGGTHSALILGRPPSQED